MSTVHFFRSIFLHILGDAQDGPLHAGMKNKKHSYFFYANDYLSPMQKNLDIGKITYKNNSSYFANQVL
jgi:hypothetical protein